MRSLAKQVGDSPGVNCGERKLIIVPYLIVQLLAMFHLQSNLGCGLGHDGWGDIEVEFHHI